MRYVNVRYVPREGTIHPFVQRIATDDRANGGKIHRLEQVDRDSIILLGEAYGDLDRYRELAEQCPEVLDYSLSGAEKAYVYLHLELTPLSRVLMDVHQPTELTFNLPMHFDHDGALVVTLVGDDSAFSDSIVSMPEEIDVEIREMGEYVPDADDLYMQLTDRQQDILERALDMGYYEHPRNTTHAAIAETLGVSAATVTEHLQKIEARVFADFLGR